MTKKTIKNSKNYSINKFPIAIIGMGVRYPGNICGSDGLWKALIEGRDSITSIPADRWNIAKYYDPDPNKSDKIKTKKGGFISGMKKFDASFFDIYPNIAEKLDPRQRHLLEVVYESLEDANITMEQINNSKTSVITGVFLGDEGKKYAGSDISNINAHSLMGSSDVTVPARIAYQFNLKGPTLSVDTACSSSLVAVQIACSNIWLGDADMAIAGGVNIMSSHEHFIGLSKGGFLSPDGYCKSFDADGKGYVRGEGAGVVILKPLDQAEKDGNNIYAVIKNAVVNFDGYTKDGMTVPNEFAQQKMLEDAYSGANIDPSEVDYVEAHGTGTIVGDPKECTAFGHVFAKDRDVKKPLIIGSIKSNIGHTEAVAGIAGLTKLALCIKNKQIPQNLHFNNPNPKIKFDEWKLKVPTKLMNWPGKKDKKAIAGVNSFGAGGTNAHIVLEEYISDFQQELSKQDKDEYNFPYVFSLSAASLESLKKLAERYIDFINNSQDDLLDICYSILKNRSNLKEKLVIICNSKEDLIKKLSLYISDSKNPQIITGKTKKDEKLKIAFICSGQGPQWYGMGRQLMAKSQIFADISNKIDRIFFKIAGYSILEEMSKDSADSKISETRIAQPAIMIIQIGLIEIWKSFGIDPDGIVGHSIGEVAAAYGAGSLNLEQAVNVIYNRSKEQDKASGKGKMLATSLPLSKSIQITQKYNNQVSIAALNGPESTVLSGDIVPLEEIAQELEEKEIFNRFLKINVPFHSHYMEMTKEEMLKSLKDLEPKRANISLYSTVTGLKESGLNLNANYWYKNVRDTVYFVNAIEKMINDGFNYFIEIAPHPILGAGVNDMLSVQKKDGYVISSLSRNIKNFEAGIEYEVNDILSATAKTQIATQKVNLLNIYKQYNPKSIKLPNYIWNHKEYWSESKEHEISRLKKQKHPFIKNIIKSLSDKNSAIIELDLNPNKHLFLNDHKIDGVIVIPGTAHFEIATAIGKEIYGDKFSHLEDIHFKKALFLPDDGYIEARLELKSSGKYTIHSKLNNKWTNNSSGKICHSNKKQVKKFEKLEDLKKRINKELSKKEFYNKLQERGLFYGANFRIAQKIYCNENEILSEIGIDKNQEIDEYNVIPNISDCCLHTILSNNINNIYLPDRFNKITIFNKPTKIVFSYIRIIKHSTKFLLGDIFVYDYKGNPVFCIEGMQLKLLENFSKKKQNHNYEFQWFKSDISINNKAVDKNFYIIIFINNNLINLLGDKLLDIGNNIIFINKGIKFKKESEYNYIINPNSQEDFSRLFHHLAKENVNIAKIINFWPIDGIISNNDNCYKLSQESQNLLLPNLYLLQEIAKFENNKIYLYQITQNADIVDDKKDKNINFLQGSLYGMGRVFMNEYPNHHIRMIDIGCPKIEDNINLIIAEINKEEQIPYETEIAIRDYGRFARKLVEFDQKKQPNRDLAFTPNSTYLITGGPSGLGLTLAQWLFEEKNIKNFALMSRSGPKYDQDKKIISQMQQKGANIIWQEVIADVTKENEVQKAIDYIKDNMPPLKGIIHSAGLLDDSSIPNMNKEKFFKIFNPKALGGWNLHRATLDIKLDLFLLISSVSSIIGIAGQTNYSSANNFLNYLSLYRNCSNESSRAICFGMLSGSFAGMSKQQSGLEDLTAKTVGLIAMDKKLMLNSMEDTLYNSNSCYYMISSMNWSIFFESHSASSNILLLGDILKNNSKILNKKLLPIEKILSSKNEDAIDLIKNLIKNILTKILGTSMNEIDSNISISNLNLDSLMLNQLRSSIQSEFELSIPLMQLVKGPNINELSRKILKTILQQEKVDYFNDSDIEISKNKWLIKRKNSHKTKYKIICLHPVGAGASIFSHFIFNPPKNTQIIALQMPGRENRMDEDYYYNNMEKLVEDLSNQIIAEISGPTIFWGHSWGGVTLYEVIKYLRRNNIKEYQNIKQLIVTGSIAPQLTLPWKDRDSIKQTARKDNTIDKILSTVSYIDDENYLRSIIPIMKKDMEMIMTYKYKEEEKLNIPILAFGAKEDDVVLLDELKEWEKQTNDNFQLYEVSGDHWFLSRNKEFITEKIAENIMGL